VFVPPQQKAVPPSSIISKSVEIKPLHVNIEAISTLGVVKV
jgi:hypothetical protein